jgi:4-coumarate--CoA ligase
LTADGLFKTGDIAVRKDLNWWTVGQEMVVIKIDGLQVAPAELGSCLAWTLDVIDAAIVGITVHDEELPEHMPFGRQLHR